MSSSRSIPSLMRVAAPARDLEWLKDALQAAIKLEFATLPPYLIAMWSIKSPSDPVKKSIRDIVREEMAHYGLACNMLTAIGGTPVLNQTESVPTYPGGLPGGVHPGLVVALKRLTKDQAKVFMDIEYPQGSPVALLSVETFASIGEFYDAILSVFETLEPNLAPDQQLEGPLSLFKIDSLDRVGEAIELIKRQGEGSNASPEDSGPNDLAHYYRFGEVFHGKKLIQDPQDASWGFNGPDVMLPDTWPMAEVPANGYQQADVPDADTWTLILRFDQEFTAMLDQLQAAWDDGDDGALSEAVGTMFEMRRTAVELMQKQLPAGGENYGPCFRLLID